MGLGPGKKGRLWTNKGCISCTGSRKGKPSGPTLRAKTGPRFLTETTGADGTRLCLHLGKLRVKTKFFVLRTRMRIGNFIPQALRTPEVPWTREKASGGPYYRHGQERGWRAKERQEDKTCRAEVPGGWQHA